MMARLLHLADLHLGAPFGGFGELAEERARRVLDAFRGLPDLAVREEVHAVLVAGDLFDGPRPGDATVAAVQEVARRLAAAEVPLFAVPGNHDAPSLNPGLYEEALRDAVVFLRPAFGAPASVETGGGPIHVYGVAYDPAEQPDPLATFRRADLDGLHVALLHGAVQGAPHWEGGTALRLRSERLATLEVDYLALGDLHRHRPPEAFPAGVPACYPGSFAAVTLAESGPHGAVVVEVAPGEPPEVRLVESGVPPVVHLDAIDVTSLADEAAIAGAIGERLPAEAVPVIRLTGEPVFPLDPERVRVRLAERYGCAAVEDATRYYDSARLGALARQKTVAGHVARLGLERTRETEDDEARRVAQEGLRIALRALGVE